MCDRLKVVPSVGSRGFLPSYHRFEKVNKIDAPCGISANVIKGELHLKFLVNHKKEYSFGLKTTKMSSANETSCTEMRDATLPLFKGIPIFSTPA